MAFKRPIVAQCDGLCCCAEITVHARSEEEAASLARDQGWSAAKVWKRAPFGPIEERCWELFCPLCKPAK